MAADSSSTSDRHSGSPSGGRRPHRLAYGVEKIGLVSLRFPITSLIVLVLLAVAAAFGFARIKVDDSLSQLFRSDTPEFRQFLDVTQRFPSSEYDILVVVEGKPLLERGPLDQLRNLVTRPAARRGHARHHLTLLGAHPAAGRTRFRGRSSPRRCRKARPTTSSSSG